MSFDDFVKNFSNMDICHMINTSFFSFSKKYKESVFYGSWKKPHLSGGCGNYDTFLQNPQVRGSERERKRERERETEGRERGRKREREKDGEGKLERGGEGRERMRGGKRENERRKEREREKAIYREIINKAI